MDRQAPHHDSRSATKINTTRPSNHNNPTNHISTTRLRDLTSYNETTVGGWVKKYRATHAADEPPLELSERARLRELERRNRELEMENAFLKKASAYFAREQR